MMPSGRDHQPAADRSIEVRPRSDDDLDRCEALARIVRERDGYPPHLPAELRRFVASPDALGAWVAVADGAVVGHVALHRSSSPPVMAMACEATGLVADRLGVVARLFVDPDVRRRGVATALLERAVAEADDRGLVAVLDVATHFSPAIALYEKQGFRRAGGVIVPFRDEQLHQVVFVLYPRLDGG